MSLRRHQFCKATIHVSESEFDRLSNLTESTPAAALPSDEFVLAILRKDEESHALQVSRMEKTERVHEAV